MRKWIQGFFIWIGTSILAWLTPPFLKQFFEINMDEIASEIVSSFLGTARTVSLVQVQAWMFIAISVILFLYWLWPYRNMAIKLPVIKKTPASQVPTSAAPGTTWKVPSRSQEVPQPQKRLYPPPDDAKNIVITTLSNKELGKLIEICGEDTLKFERRLPYNVQSGSAVSQFLKVMAPRILWAYEECKFRDHKGEQHLEALFANPNYLRSRDDIKWLGQALIPYGASVALRADD